MSVDLPSVVKKDHLTWAWRYRDEASKPIAIVVRYDQADKAKARKKWFHQYHLQRDGEWAEGAPTPSPLFGVDTLSKSHSEQVVYIFEGEKCAQVAHHLELSALTSMRGSNQAPYADWAILAKYRHIRKFILVPDNDDAGKSYMEAVHLEIKKASPEAIVEVCLLPLDGKGDDLVDWIKQHSHCPPDWNGFDPIDEPFSRYLRLAFEGYAEKNSIVAEEYFNRQPDSKPTFLEDPEPIQEVLTAVLPCPVHTLPAAITNWIKASAEQMQTPEDYLSASLLVFVGSLIGRKRALLMRPGTDWFEFSNLWGMLVGRPSAMKSPAMQTAKRPLIALAEEAKKEHSAAFQQYQRALEAWKIRKKGAEEVYKYNYKESINKNALEKPLNVPYLHIEEPPKEPKERRYKSEDPTVEKLAELLIENPQGLLVYRDELKGWLLGFDKPGRENDRQFFLESWSGKQDFNVDRIGRGELHVPALFLSIFGSIQPGPLAHYVRSTIKGGMGDDGLLQRFQVMVWPDMLPDWKLVHGQVPIEVLEAPVHGIFQWLNQLQFDDEGQPILLPFTEEAQAHFDTWQEQHERRLRKGDLPPHMESHLAKYKKLLAALCLGLEHLHYAVDRQYPKAISKQRLEDTMLWLDYFEIHAKRIFGSSANAVPEAAKNLIQRIQKGEIKEPFSIRDVYYKHHWSGLSTAEEVQEVVDYLEEKQYLIGKSIKTAGRPMIKYWAHPQILDLSS